jgi:hypothetical protein
MNRAARKGIHSTERHQPPLPPSLPPKLRPAEKTWLSDTAYTTAGDALADPIFVFYYDYYLRSVDRKEGNGRGDEAEERRGVYR